MGAEAWALRREHGEDGAEPRMAAGSHTEPRVLSPGLTCGSLGGSQ